MLENVQSKLHCQVRRGRNCVLLMGYSLYTATIYTVWDGVVVHNDGR